MNLLFRVRLGMATATALIFALVASSAHAENLLPDPSFEKAGDRNRFGQVFPEWAGWIYGPPARFVASPIAHSGKLSCEIVADSGAKVRMFSKPTPFAPGRYRVKAWLRGLDIGNLSHATDFAVQVDGPWFRLGKVGTFGWTPLTYTFEVAPGDTKPRQVFFGLVTSGRLWVDDVSLEKVDDTEPLTPQPVLGAEEAPIAPPSPLTAQATRCPECGYRIDPSWERCYACGTAREMATGRSGPPVLVLADFESGSIKPFLSGTLERTRPIVGTGSLLLEKKYAMLEMPMDWSGYDYLRFEVVNPSAQVIPLTLEIRDSETKDYWTRVNVQTAAPPGRSTVSIPTALYVGEKSRPGRLLLRNQVRRFVVDIGDRGPVTLDNFRLERLDTASVQFPELLAFDFGPEGSPLCEGFERAGAGTIYSAGRGLGWVKPSLWRSLDALQPDALARDFVCVNSGVFRVDLPNGKYHGMIMVDCPAGYWGELPRYRKRSVTANGRTVVSDGWDFASFRDWYFRDAAREDPPGADPFDRYVMGAVPERRFEFEVADGKLEIAFQGADWSICLSALVIWPDTKKEAGEKFLAWVLERRRAQFAEQFKRGDAPRTGDAAPAKGARLFRRHPMAPPMAQDGPRPGEETPGEGLRVAAAAGEETMLSFSLQVAPTTGGEIGIEAGPFTAAGGASLPASAILPGWLDFRVTRVVADGSIYTVKPRYWRPVPAPDSRGLTRTFWVRVRIPADAKPGEYRGALAVKPASGSPLRVAATVRVLPFKLDPIRDLPVGPWGVRIPLPWFPDDPATRQWEGRMLGQNLDALREAGCTTFSGLPDLAAKAAGGKITLETERADREMTMARERGFDQLVCAYGSGSSLGYRPYGNAQGPDDAAAKDGGFPDAAAFLKALWSEVNAHATRAGWTKVAWNLCDEPVGEAVAASAKNALAHRAVAAGLDRVVFMGATSLHGNDPKDPHLALAQALPLAALNNHDEEAIRAIQSAGNAFAFYNGGNRWTHGRYMKMLVAKHRLALRLSWHFNVVAGNPYSALDCREDDYCWFNTNAAGELIPSLDFLVDVLPGLNDYRALTTLDRLLRENPNHPAAAAAQKVYEEMIALSPGGTDRQVAEIRHREGKLDDYDKDRARVDSAIESLLVPASR